MKPIATAMAAAAALFGTSAQAAVQTCLVPAEMNALFTYFLPQVIDRAVEGCSAHLPATSYLRSRLSGRADDLRSQADAIWPEARAAVIKIAGADAAGAKKMQDTPDEELRSTIDAELISASGLKINPKDCGEINDISEALAPLSTTQAVHLLVVTFSALNRKGIGLTICPRGETGQG
jgi:hypothetical protein